LPLPLVRSVRLRPEPDLRLRLALPPLVLLLVPLLVLLVVP
jgi:hypothetical protein